jgi:hypothetical protein
MLRGSRRIASRVFFDDAKAYGTTIDTTSQRRWFERDRAARDNVPDKPMNTAKTKTFTARLEAAGDQLQWVIARVPFDIAKAWPERNGSRMLGSINDFAFRRSLLREKGATGHFLVVNRQMQAKAGAGPGDRVRITLEPDMEVRGGEMPVELARALKGARGLRKYFDAMSPSLQKVFSSRVGEPKSAGSRLNRAEKVAETLLQAMEGEEYPPPILRAAFQRQPLAEAGWNAMTRIKRRNHLLGIFYCQTADARERRAQLAMDDALCVAKRKSAQSGVPM